MREQQEQRIADEFQRSAQLKSSADNSAVSDADLEEGTPRNSAMPINHTPTCNAVRQSPASDGSPAEARSVVTDTMSGSISSARLDRAEEDLEPLPQDLRLDMLLCIADGATTLSRLACRLQHGSGRPTRINLARERQQLLQKL